MSPKPKFDPSKSFEAVDAEKPKFDPSKPFEASGLDEESGATTFASLLEGAGDGVTLGYAPNIKAAVAKGVSAITPFKGQDVLATIDSPIEDVFSGKAYEDLPEADSYVDLRDLADKRGKKVTGANPMTALAGNLAGGLALAGGGSALLNAGKAPTVGRAIAEGAAFGGLSNTENKEGQVELDIMDRLKNAGIGGVAGGALAKISRAIPGAKAAVQESAENMAAKSLGRGSLGLKQKIGEDKFQAIGREALDSGVVGTIPKTAKGLDDKVLSLRKEVGQDIGKIIDRVDDAERTMSNLDAVGLNKKQIADRLRSELIDPDLFQDPAMVEKIEKRIAAFMSRGGDAPSIATKAAQDIKVKIGNATNWKRIKMGQATDEDIFNAKMYSALSDGIMDSVNKIAPELGEGVQGQVSKLNKKYSIYKDMQAITSKEAARSNTNDAIGLGSIMAGAGQLATGNPLSAIATAVGVQGLKNFGPQVGAKALDTVSKVLPSALPASLPLAGAIGAQQLADSKLSVKTPPTQGAKVLKMSEYDTAPGVPVPPGIDVVGMLKSSSLTNVEKAKILRRYSKDGTVSEDVIQYFQNGGK